MTAYRETAQALREQRQRIAALREEMRSLQASIEPERVEDYEFAGAAGPVRLSELFGGKRDLFVIHNMGSRCAYCTLWADGLNGLYDHVADRAAFVVSSPNSPEAQAEFATSRGWRFPMVSHAGTSFAEDMGYKREEVWWPGVSVFQKRDGALVRVSDGEFGPGDDFCGAWHLFDLIPEGVAGWEPKFSYVADQK
jgi:predicted dithiol-disulfide oxidoreductase (DUF899 family)